MDKTQNSKIKITIMYFMELLCDTCFNEDHLKLAAAELTSLFEKYIVDQDIKVSIAAVKATISFLSNIQDNQFIKKFSQILPVLLQTLITAVKEDEDSGVTIIQSLGDLIETHPAFVKPIIEDLLATLTEIFKTSQLTDGTRNQALNCLEGLAQNCDVAMRKSETFKKVVIPALMQLLCGIKEVELDEWLKELDGQTVSKTDPYFAAQDTIAKLSDSLKSKFLLPQFVPYITECIQNDQWNVKYAGYTAIGQLAEGSSAFFGNDLDNMMQLVIAGFSSEDPRVLYSVVNAVAFLSSEYAVRIYVIKYLLTLFSPPYKKNSTSQSLRIS